MNCKKPLKIRYLKTKSESLNEIWVNNGTYQTYDYIYVPCGKCDYCIDKKTKEFSKRLMHEYETMNYKGYFVTLTKDEPYLSPNGVNKRELQLYLKRLRKNLNNKKIKYFASAQYGSKYGREHYHIIILGVSKEDKEQIEFSWGMGIVDIKPVNYNTIRYVVNYMNMEIIPEIINGRNFPFTLKSKGLGLNWLKKYYQEITEDKCIITNGYKTSIPRYYLKKLKDNTIPLGDSYYEYITDTNHEISPNYELEKHGIKQYIPTTSSDYIERPEIAEQINRNLSALKRLRNK